MALERRELASRREHRALHRLLAQLAAAEIRERPVHAAHVQAVRLERLETLAEHDLRRAAADVDDEPARRVVREVVRDAEVDEARFFGAGDDLDRVSERFRGAIEERARVARLPQRARADRAHAADRHRAEALAETREARERFLLHGLGQVLLRVEARGEAHALAQAVDDRELVAFEPRDDHVEAVGAEIDGRDHVDVGRRGHAVLLPRTRRRGKTAFAHVKHA